MFMLMNPVTFSHLSILFAFDIVNDWNYRYRCVAYVYVYVFLSRARTLAGLYLMKPLDLERSFNVPQNLIRFEQRLKANKERQIPDMLVLGLGYQSNAEIDGNDAV